MQEKSKQKYKLTKAGYFHQTQIVVLRDDYDPKIDSFEEAIEKILSDDFHKETNNLYFEIVE